MLKVAIELKTVRERELTMQYVNTYNQIRRQLYLKKNYDRAERLVQRLFRIMKEQAHVGEYPFKPIPAFCELGAIYLARKKYGRALWCFSRAAALHGPADPKWCGLESTWVDQARVHMARCDYEQADKLYAQAIASVTDKDTRDDTNMAANNGSILASIMTEYAACLSKQHKYSESETFAAMASDLKRQARQNGFG